MIADNVARIQAQITQAAERSGRDAASVTLVAVCKTKPVEMIVEAAEAGVRHFGENRVEEANPKMLEVASRVAQPLIWHMVGHVQSRKARDVVSYQGVRRFSLVHSLDDLSLAGRLARLIEEAQGEPLPVLAQINISGEDSKFGVPAHLWHSDSQQRARAFEFLRGIVALPQLALTGLMTIAPIADQPEDVRPVFRHLREFRDAAQQELGCALPQLSMGMTDDFTVAIEEGATLVRVGRAVFGDR
jgi:pyridoxal phosphate enzyme (YggS family)